MTNPSSQFQIANILSLELMCDLGSRLVPLHRISAALCSVPSGAWIITRSTYWLRIWLWDAVVLHPFLNDQACP